MYDFFVEILTENLRFFGDSIFAQYLGESDEVIIKCMWKLPSLSQLLLRY